jgi:hypothetical protein
MYECKLRSYCQQCQKVIMIWRPICPCRNPLWASPVPRRGDSIPVPPPGNLHQPPLCCLYWGSPSGRAPRAPALVLQKTRIQEELCSSDTLLSGSWHSMAHSVSHPIPYDIYSELLNRASIIPWAAMAWSSPIPLDPIPIPKGFHVFPPSKEDYLNSNKTQLPLTNSRFL